ncbi:hypothetical protein L2E82_06395 [Cichorium intybus]|uniref:Uncharacterized protein n=1 Tax=Cichorium intybus TaxID=13427 RepID=A0ACB9HB14_CICIN|nr:hypothetical protein L2E82_06395 [Cichorium intybus]
MNEFSPGEAPTPRNSITSQVQETASPNTEDAINRERELQALSHLSAAGFGSKLLGVFETGMVQSFIHAPTLEPSDCKWFRNYSNASDLQSYIGDYSPVLGKPNLDFFTAYFLK